VTTKKYEMIEGPEAFRRFRAATKAVIGVPYSVIKKQMDAHRKQAAKNPNRRGPKQKA